MSRFSMISRAAGPVCLAMLFWAASAWAVEPLETYTNYQEYRYGTLVGGVLSPPGRGPVPASVGRIGGNHDQ